MKRKLYIHVGVHRTATTSTQRFLKTNFVPLQKKGYFNPYAAGRNFELFNKIFNGTMSIQEVSDDIAARADSKKFPIDAIILSDEDVCSRPDLTLLAGFREHFDVQVILVMRRQDLWIESWYQQNVKWQWNPALSHLRFPEFLARRAEFFWIDYDRMVQTLEALFGPENVHCLVFERGEMPEGPVAAFCKTIGLTDMSGFKPAPWANTSLSPMMTEFMRTLPLDEIEGVDRRIFEQACIEADQQVRALSRQRQSMAAAAQDQTGAGQTGAGQTGAGQSGAGDNGAGKEPPALFMDAATRVAVLAEYAQGNAALARRRFGRDRLFQDPLPPADAPVAPQSLPADSYEAMQDLVAPLIRALAARLAKDRLDAELPALEGQFLDAPRSSRAG